jgi:hypothetical protein
VQECSKVHRLGDFAGLGEELSSVKVFDFRFPLTFSGEITLSAFSSMAFFFLNSIDGPTSDLALLPLPDLRDGLLHFWARKRRGFQRPTTSSTP